ncbi:uncharacterized protein [Ptychodera flava]|uniref:uncharacterized protein n=1 Tax=Ptychodera flava TaxID=63121 RepID=UPI003969D3DD
MASHRVMKIYTVSGCFPLIILLMSTMVIQSTQERTDSIFHYTYCAIHQNIQTDEEMGIADLLSSIAGDIQLRQLDLRSLFPAERFPIQIRFNLKNFDISSDAEYSIAIHEFGVIYEGSCALSGERIVVNDGNGSQRTSASLRPDDTGALFMNFIDIGISLTGQESIVGRSLVIHGNGQSDLEVKYNSTRLACCIIGESDGRSW